MSVDDFDKWFSINIFADIQSLIVFKKALQGWVNCDRGAFNDVGGIYCLIDFQKWDDYTALVWS